jgi:hypothetical protein
MLRHVTFLSRPAAHSPATGRLQLPTSTLLSPKGVQAYSEPKACLGLEEVVIGYVLAVPKSQHVPRFGRIDHLFTQAPDEAWEKCSCGDGAKGPRVYHRAVVQLPAIEDFDGETPTHQRWALARRSVARPDGIA